MSLGQQGFSLFEVIISLLVLSLSIMAIASLQAFTLKKTEEIYLTNLASTQLLQMSDIFCSHPGINELLVERWLNNNSLLPISDYTVSKTEAFIRIQLSWLQHTAFLHQVSGVYPIKC